MSKNENNGDFHIKLETHAIGEFYYLGNKVMMNEQSKKGCWLEKIKVL